MRSEQPGAAETNPEEKSATSKPYTSTPDDRARVIESLAQLLSSGRPLSEVLAEAKHLAETLPTPTVESGHHPTPASATASAAASSARDTGSADHCDLATDGASAALAHCGNEGEIKSIRLARLTSGAVLWLFPAAIIAVLATAAAAMLVNLPREKQSSFLALTLTAGPEIAPIEKTEAALATHPEPQYAEPLVSTAKQWNSERSKAGQQLSPEQVSLLLARGDELVRRADVVSGRLFYERAADAADARAALRLGASYDPSFLAQAGIRGVRGDPALATHWYKRAHDLGAGAEAEALLKGLNSD